MAIKILCCLVIVLCAGKIGFGIAAGYTRRIQELNAFMQGLRALRREISFCLTPMQEALDKAAAGLPAPVAAVFLNASANLSVQGQTAGTAWSQALRSHGKGLRLAPSDLEALDRFGALLGSGDLDIQTNNIAMAVDKLGALEQQAVLDEQKYAKPCRSLGVLFGLFLALIFI